MFGWLLVDFGLPTFIIAVFWPVVAFLQKQAHAFDRVFHSADLMPLGAILLLAAVRELETEFQMQRISNACAKRRMLGTVSAIGLLFVYALLKYYTLTAHIPETEDVAVDRALDAISVFSIAVITFCGFFALYLKSSIYMGLGDKDVH